MSAAQPVAIVPARRGPLERFLALFTEVQSGESVTALLLTLNVFLLLAAYYLLKTAREPLILAGGGAEVKSYAAAGQALMLLGLVPLYGRLASAVDRAKLITGVTAFFAMNLVCFYFLAQAHVPLLGVAFFLWVGIFNMLAIAQFWSFANDVYTPDQGKRLFVIVAFGASSGAVVGSWVAGRLIPIAGVYPLLLVAAGVLLGCAALTVVVDRRERAASATARGAADPAPPLGSEGAFRLIARDRYLLLIALLMMVLNWVNTNGEYILSKTVATEATRLAAAAHGAASADALAAREDLIGRFYAGYFGWVNLVGMLAQLFVVSRVFKWVGVRGALFVLPVIALGGYSLLAAAPILAYVRIAKIAENATDYSLQNTTRHALWLPTSREAKYKAKAAIDSLFVRGGDLLSSALVYIGAQLALGPRHFAAVNLALVVVWIALAWGIAREHRKRSPVA